ncbi:MAG: glycosyltransferase family 2 protein [Candidatus Heimdallarchaeota archaeon]
MDYQNRLGPPKVSIIILNWNGLRDTMECLESLKKVYYPNYDVIVVDNGSEGNDVEVLKQKYGDYVHIIENHRNYGFAEGNNKGIRYALSNLEPEYVLLLNSDTTVDHNFLTELIKVAERDSKVAIVGSKIYYYNEQNKINSAGAVIDLWKGRSNKIGVDEIDVGQFDKIREVDYVGGSCFLIRRTAIENIGMLDPEYFAYWEETDYCVRAHRVGYKIIYVPQAIIWHKEAASTGKTSKLQVYYLTRNRLLFMKKNAKLLHKITFIPFLIKDILFLLASVLFKKRDSKATYNVLIAILMVLRDMPRIIR